MAALIRAGVSKEVNLPLLIKTTIHMLEMEAQRQPSIGDAWLKKTLYKPRSKVVYSMQTNMM